MELPPLLSDIQGKKPWEVKLLDTMELWKFGDFKSYTSLDLLTAVLGIPSPKSDMDGSDVSRVFYEEKDLSRLKKYCEEDVVATIQVMMKFAGMGLIGRENISN
jgi:predicted PolB exonuclease-like 3'-5' exonuclease